MKNIKNNNFVKVDLFMLEYYTTQIQASLNSLEDIQSEYTDVGVTTRQDDLVNLIREHFEKLVEVLEDIDFGEDIRITRFKACLNLGNKITVGDIYKCLYLDPYKECEDFRPSNKNVIKMFTDNLTELSEYYSNTDVIPKDSKDLVSYYLTMWNEGLDKLNELRSVMLNIITQIKIDAFNNLGHVAMISPTIQKLIIKLTDCYDLYV